MRSQIYALKAAAIAKQKRHEVLAAIGAEWNDLRLAVQSKLDQLIVQQDQLIKSMIQCEMDKMQFTQDQMSRIEQLILPVRTELSSLKSDHEHKTQILENKVKEQNEQISELMDQIEKMKVSLLPQNPQK